MSPGTTLERMLGVGALAVNRLMYGEPDDPYHSPRTVSCHLTSIYSNS